MDAWVCLTADHSQPVGWKNQPKSQLKNWKMATRGKSIKITIESIDGCEKERSTKINIEELKNGKLGDQHIRSATECCWTSQISSRQVYQLFRWKIRHMEGFQKHTQKTLWPNRMLVIYLKKKKIPMLCLQKLFFSRAKLVLSPIWGPNLMFIWVHFFILLIKMMSTSPSFFGTLPM